MKSKLRINNNYNHNHDNFYLKLHQYRVNFNLRSWFDGPFKSWDKDMNCSSSADFGQSRTGGQGH